MDVNTLFGPDAFAADTDLVDNLTKALTAGYGYEGAPGSLTGGGALQVESLDNTLKSVTWSYQHLKFWPVIPKDKAFNTVEQFNRQTTYGSQQEGGFFDAELGFSPQPQDANFFRDYQKVRYIGTQRSVTHPLTLVRTAHAPAVALQIKAGTMWILEQMERQLWMANGYFQNAADGTYTGNTTALPASSLKFNGVDQQIRSGISNPKVQYTGFDGYGPALSPVKDQAGSVPDEDDITDWAYVQAANFGVPGTAFWPLKALADVSRTMLPKERIVPPGQEGRGGFLMSEFIAGSGVFKMAGSRFLEPKRSPLTAASSGYTDPYGVSSYNPPATPVLIAVGGLATDSGVEADATSTLAAGNFYYRVAAVNNVGESLACSDPGGVLADLLIAVAAGQRAKIAIAQPLAGAAPSHYAIYRSSVQGSGWEFIGFVAREVNPAVQTYFRDIGAMHPGLGHAYLMQMDADNIVWRQLAPLMKMDLAIIGPAYRWMQLLYGTPIVFASLHHSIMDNIGRA